MALAADQNDRQQRATQNRHRRQIWNCFMAMSVSSLENEPCRCSSSVVAAGRQRQIPVQKLFERLRRDQYAEGSIPADAGRSGGHSQRSLDFLGGDARHVVRYQADRRTFLQASAAAGAGYWVTGGSRPPKANRRSNRFRSPASASAAKARATSRTCRGSARSSPSATSTRSSSRAWPRPTRPSTTSPTTARCSTSWATRSTR